MLIYYNLLCGHCVIYINFNLTSTDNYFINIAQIYDWRVKPTDHPTGHILCGQR